MPLWVCEGIKQLRLHAALVKYCEYMQTSALFAGAEPAILVERLQKEAIDPLLGMTWIPDAKSLVCTLGTANQEKFWQVEKFLMATAAVTGDGASSFTNSPSGWKSVLAASRNQTATGLERSVRDAAIESCNRRKVSEEEVVSCWLAEAKAIFGWFMLQPELAALEKDTDRADAVAKNCRRCLFAIEADLKSASANTGCFYEDLIRKAADQLTEAAAALERNRSRGTLSIFSRQEISELLGRAGSDWPPLAVARWLSLLESQPRTLITDLLTPVEHAIPGCRRLADGPRNYDNEVRGKICLLFVLLAQLDRRICEGQADSELIKDFDKLQDTFGLPVRIERWGTESRDVCPDAWEPPLPVTEGGERLVRSCLVVISGREWHVLQSGIVEVPARRGRLAIALQALRRHPKANRTVVDLCAEVRNRLIGAKSLQAWWNTETSVSAQSLPSEGLLALYRLLASAIVAAIAEPSLEPVVDELRAALETNGITVGPVVVDPPSLATSGWLLLAAPIVRPAGVGGVDDAVWGLRGPNGHVFVSSFWLRLPERWTRTRPVVAVILAQQSLWLHLRTRWPDATCWPEVDAAIARILAEAELTADMPVSLAAVELFRLLYDTALAAEEKLGLQLRALAKPIYEALGDGGRSMIGLPLDAETLLPRVVPLLEAWRCGQRPSVTVRWTESSQPFGTVIAARLSQANVPASLNLSLGPDCPAETRTLVAIPSPEGICLEQAGLSAGPLKPLFDQLQVLPLESQPAERLSTAVKTFVAEVLTPAGRKWFNCFFQAASAIGAGSCGPVARQWMEAILVRGWCHCFPEIDTISGKPRGPATKIPAGWDYSWDFSATVPVGEILLERSVVFSPTPEGACATFSRGPRVAGSLIDLSYRLLEEAASAGNTSSAVLQASLKELQRAADRQVRNGEAVEALADRLGVALDRLCEAAYDAGGHQHPSDALLVLLRAWGAAVGIGVEPPGWCFANPRAADAVLIRDGQEPPAICFSHQVPRGAIAVQRFGLRASNRVIRPSEAFRSGGAAPIGFEKLLACTRREFPQLAPTLDFWPAAALDDMLPFVAQQFYIDLWKAVEEARRGRDEPMRQTQQTLLDLLVSEFHLQPFYPATYREVPENWLEVRAPNGIRRERVVRVVRPGLKDHDGKLRVTAIVEVE